MNSTMRRPSSVSIPSTANRGPFSVSAWTNGSSTIPYSQDFAHSKLLLSESESATKGAQPKLTITTLSKYEEVSKQIQKAWLNIGIKTEIKVTDRLPDNFQIFLGDFKISKDPDQYTLWHSAQPNNITNYKSLRIDKLLEDGRKTVDFSERQKIYSDFQKYLLDDAPASFLYLPYSYQVTRK